MTLSDAAGNQVSAAAIASISYTLSDLAGAVINSLQDEQVTPANPVDIVLSAEAMTVGGTPSLVGLLLTVTWVYNDSVLGDNSQRTVEYSLLVNNAVNK